MTTTFELAKVGDKVWSANRGWGKVAIAHAKAWLGEGGLYDN